MTTTTWKTHRHELHRLFASVTRIVGLVIAQRAQVEHVVEAIFMVLAADAPPSAETVYRAMYEALRELDRDPRPVHPGDSPALAALRRLPLPALLALTLTTWERRSAREVAAILGTRTTEVARLLDEARRLARPTWHVRTPADECAATHSDSPRPEHHATYPL